MKITIFGLAGTGTSTIGKELASRLDYIFNSTGNMFREMAKEHGMSVYEFDEMTRENLKYDLELDERVAVYGKENDDFIFESRLAWNFIPDSIKIMLNCDEDVAIKRIAERENISFKEAKEKTQKRAKTLEFRYAKCYPDLEYPPKKEIFDLVIDTTSMLPEEIVEKIMSFLDKKES